MNTKTLDELLSTNSKKKTLNINDYADQTRQRFIDNNGYTYPIVNINNKSNILSESIYVGNNYFLTILPYDVYKDLLKNKNNYKFLDGIGTQDIIDIITNSNPIENKYFIILFTISNIDNITNLFIFNIITYINYLSLEKIGNLLQTFSSYSNLTSTVIQSANNYSFTTDNTSQLYIGTPLFIDNTVVGLFFRQTESSSFFLRLSNISSWLGLYNVISVLDDTGYVPFNNQQLYSIIVSLQNRIIELENKM